MRVCVQFSVCASGKWQEPALAPITLGKDDVESGQASLAVSLLRLGDGAELVSLRIDE